MNSIFVAILLIFVIFVFAPEIRRIINPCKCWACNLDFAKRVAKRDRKLEAVRSATVLSLRAKSARLDQELGNLRSVQDELNRVIAHNEALIDRKGKPMAISGFCLADAMQKELSRWRPATARGIYKKLRRQGIALPFSVKNVQTMLDQLTVNQRVACTVPARSPSGRLRRNHTSYRIAA